MKTKLLSIVILIAATAFAQEAPSEKKGFITNWYYGFGITGNSGYNISANLLEAGVKRVPDVMPSVFIGWTAALNDKLAFDIEFGASGLFWNKKGTGSQLIQAPARFRLQYTALDKEMFSISAGANFSMVGNDLSIWSEDTDIDMDNLDPEAATGYIRLRNTSYFAGPSATVKLKDKGETVLIFNIGYEFGISGTKWKSDYARLSNVVKEQNNQFFVNLALPF